jgi:hypothetical protein
MNLRNKDEFGAKVQASVDEVVQAFTAALGGIQPDWHIKERPDGPFLVIEFCKPSEFHFKILNGIVLHLDDENIFKERCIVSSRKAAPKSRLLLPETQLLKKTITESLTVDRNSFKDDFFSRYTKSVTSLEQQITTKANFIVFGRRGAGKSSLLAYAMHKAIESGWAYSWVAMQTFARRSDLQVVPAVLSAILFELHLSTGVLSDSDELIKLLDSLVDSSDATVLSKVDKLIPRIRRSISSIVTSNAPLTIFLDDLHVLDESVQPTVLAFIYKICRGNNAYIKISGISQLTKSWNSSTSTGLQPPHDAQIVSLDLNLTMPDKSEEHIVSILDAHAKFCGLPNIGYITGDGVISRLVLVAAGVPRDALSLFSVGISKAIAKSQKLVSVTSVNAAASEMAEEKLKDVELDTGGDLVAVEELLAELKQFCISVKRKNSFLVEIKNSSKRYKLVQRLVELRLVHMLHEGITPHKAGKRFVALMLDYGFYVGVRAARSVDFIPSEPRQLSAKELRSLPIFV